MPHPDSIAVLTQILKILTVKYYEISYFFKPGAVDED